MQAIKSKLLWLLTGVIGTHVGHFIYQKYYLKKIAGIRLSEVIAMVIEDLLQLMLSLLDKLLPVLTACRPYIPWAIVLVIVTAVFYVWLKIYLRLKGNRQYQDKIKEAEAVLATARKKATAHLEKVEELKLRLTTEFERKESALQNEIKGKLKEYIVRIKNLEKERLELKEMNGNLMRKLKAG